MRRKLWVLCVHVAPSGTSTPEMPRQRSCFRRTRSESTASTVRNFEIASLRNQTVTGHGCFA